MPTNYFKNGYDKIKEIIRADSNFSHLVNEQRLFLRDRLMSKDFGPKDGIMLRPITDELLEERVPGRESQYELDLIYFRKQTPEIDYDVLTENGENLIDLFRNNNRVASAEMLNDIGFVSHANWDLTGDISITGGEGLKAARFLFASGSLNGTLTQTATKRVIRGEDNQRYIFSYTIDSIIAPDGNFTLTLDRFPNRSKALPFSDGPHKIEFETGPERVRETSFVITATETTATQGRFTMDDLSLRQLIDEWHYITAQTIAYSIEPELSEELLNNNYFGFVMRVVFLKGKYD